MERRFLIAIFLCFIVLYTYNTFLAPPPPKPPASRYEAAGDRIDAVDAG
jgi:hypothetical protein